ncbi:PAS domain S-box protein, partial [Desulfovibrio oxamicus]
PAAHCVVVLLAAMALCLLRPDPAGARAALTEAEQAWLADNPDKLTLYFDKNFPPYEMLGPEGSFQGLAADVVALVEQQLGARFAKAPAPDWPTQLAALESGNIALVSVIVRTSERELYAQFTPPYADIHTAIIARRGQGAGRQLSDFVGRRVAVVKGYVTEAYVRKHSLDGRIEVVTVPNVQTGLRDVSFGVVDAMVENLAVAAHYIDREQLPNLQVVGTTDLDYPLSLGISKKYPLLCSAVLKAFAAIPPDELERAKAHWVRLDTRGVLTPDQRRMLRVAAVGAVVTVAWLVLVTWVLRRRLREKVDALDHARRKAEEQSTRLALVLAATNAGIWDYEPQTGATYYSPEWYTMLGREPDSLPRTYTGWFSLMHPDDTLHTSRILDEYMKAGGRGSYDSEFRMRHADGEWRWVLGKGQAVAWDDAGLPTRVIGLNIDIHNLKQHREAALESERRFRTIFENAPYAIVINRMSDGTYLDVNRAFLVSQGMDRDEVLRGDPLHFSGMSPEKAEAFRHAVRTQGGLHNVENAARRADGSYRHIIFSAVPVTFDGEEAILSITVDVTEKKTAEEALKASEEKYRAIFSNAPLGIFRSRYDGGFLDANPALARMLGYADREEMLRLHVSLPVHPHPAQRRRLLDMLQANPSGVRMECQLLRRDGAPFHAIVNASLQLDADGRPGFLDGSIEDVSERKLAEEQLRQSEQRFFQLFQLSPDAIVVARLTGDTVRDVNQAFIRMFGFTREEVLAAPASELPIMPPGTSLREAYQRLRRDGELRNHEFPARHKDGMPMNCLLSCALLRIDGEDHVMAVLRDITQVKKMQEVIIQTEKMVSLGGIAAGIAHEINNPLGIVLQAAQNLAQRTRPDFAKNVDVARSMGLDMELLSRYMRERKLDVFLGDIQAAALRASAIVRHMLEFSRRSESKRKVCDLPGVLHRALALAQNDYDLKKSYDFRNIDVSLRMEDDLPTINCTETEIEQVVINLLRNAAQAMATADPPVESPRIDMEVTATAGGVRVVITDNGPGMPPEVQRRAFEPFFTTKAPGVGTGLGLSVSYFIVTKGHGGQMEVESGPGRGTRFIIELPADAPATVPQEASA